MIIRGNGNVGIGTTAPASKLHVAGGEIRVDAGQAITLDVANTMYLVGASNQLRLYNGGNPVVNITTAGNVGIGTTSPANKLDVQGDISIGVSGATTVHTYYNSTTRNQIVYTNNSSFEFHEGVNERVRITAGGNVGIGTTSPADLLTLYATSQPILSLRDAGVNANYGGYIKGYGISGAGGQINIGVIDNNTYRSGIEIAEQLTSILFKTSASATERMRITSAGNVGIGTTSPGAKLQVEGTNPFIRINNTSAGDHGIKISYNGSDGHGLHLLYNAQSAVSYIDNTYQAVSGQVYGDIYIRQNVGGTMTPRIIIKADGGNVGIGTTAPDSLTHIVGSTAGDGGTFNGSGSILHLKQNTGWSGSQPWALFVEGYSYLNGFRINAADGIRALYKTASGGQLGFATSGDDPITFTQSASAERMRIAAGGNVGIGTTAPQQLLHVLGATDGYMMVQGAADAGNAGIYFKKEDTTGTMDRTKGLILFHTNVGSGFGRGHLGFCLNSADSNAIVSVSDEKFRMVDNGDFLADGDVVAYSTTISDARYKTNIQPIESALDKVNQMRGVSFDWTAVRSGREFGVIAQEIEKIAPEVVSEKELLNGDTMKTVSYTSLVPFLIESIKELTQQVNELKAQINDSSR
jgi:hypothetical protein